MKLNGIKNYYNKKKNNIKDYWKMKYMIEKISLNLKNKNLDKYNLPWLMMQKGKNKNN